MRTDIRSLSDNRMSWDAAIQIFGIDDAVAVGLRAQQAASQRQIGSVDTFGTIHPEGDFARAVESQNLLGLEVGVALLSFCNGHATARSFCFSLIKKGTN